MSCPRRRRERVEIAPRREGTERFAANSAAEGLGQPWGKLNQLSGALGAARLFGGEMGKSKEERVLVLGPTWAPFFVSIPAGYTRLRIPTWNGPAVHVEDHGRRDPKSGCRIFEREDALVSVMREKFGG